MDSEPDSQFVRRSITDGISIFIRRNKFTLRLSFGSDAEEVTKYVPAFTVRRMTRIFIHRIELPHGVVSAFNRISVTHFYNLFQYTQLVAYIGAYIGTWIGISCLDTLLSIESLYAGNKGFLKHSFRSYVGILVA